MSAPSVRGRPLSFARADSTHAPSRCPPLAYYAASSRRPRRPRARARRRCVPGLRLFAPWPFERVASKRSPPSARASAAGGAASEFPEDPPASAVTYRQLAPHVELARAERVAGGASTSRAHAPSPALPVLVGWFGCKQSHLRKYAKMYLSEKLGYDAVVCVTPPVAATLFPALGDAFAATALGAVAHARKVLAEEDLLSRSTLGDAAKKVARPACALDERPLVLHLFSNGGYLFAGNVMHAQTGFVADTETPLAEAMKTSLRRKLGMAPEPAAAARFVSSVAALVMDSAPGELEPGMVAASFNSVFSGERAREQKRFVRKRRVGKSVNDRGFERRRVSRLAPDRETPAVRRRRVGRVPGGDREPVERRREKLATRERRGGGARRRGEEAEEAQGGGAGDARRDDGAREESR